MFASTAGNNPGQSQGLLLQPGAPGFAVGQLSLQSPLPPFVASPASYREVIPQSEITFGGGSINSMRENMKTRFVQAWNIGVQRLIAKNTVIEVRYVGNRGSNVWHTYNLNEVNIFENGLLELNAQQNEASTAEWSDGLANNGPGPAAPDLEAVRRRSARRVAGQSVHQRRVHHQPAAGQPVAAGGHRDQPDTTAGWSGTRSARARPATTARPVRTR
jgi:hypothetical protein